MPRIPDHLKRSERILVFETPPRFQVLQDAADAAGQDFPSWAREVLYRAAREELARHERRGRGRRAAPIEGAAPPEITSDAEQGAMADPSYAGI